MASGLLYQGPRSRRTPCRCQLLLEIRESPLVHLPFAHTKYLCMQNMLQLDKDVSVEMSVKMIEK